MCLAIPAKVVSLDGAEQATVSLGGVRRAVNLTFVEGVAVGDYVIVHTGFAISRLDAAEAERTLALLREAGVDTGEAEP
jgi:hydrogenase expression/formation protein HypC